MRTHLPSARKIAEQLLASVDGLLCTGLYANKPLAGFTSSEPYGHLELDTMIVFISQRFKRLGNLLKVSLIKSYD